ncbi:hypothetical protein D918_08938 [Trichuris suis]|nr:hypothetical protein D918_08938 [Trichuris suis]
MSCLKVGGKNWFAEEHCKHSTFSQTTLQSGGDVFVGEGDIQALKHTRGDGAENDLAYGVNKRPELSDV